MMLKFDKYQGAGNDFIVIDGRKTDQKLFNELYVKHLCDRHFGIGADGLILLLHSSRYDFKMKYFNSDGKEGSMCGNGGRCIVAYAKKHEFIKDKCIFEGIDGIHEAIITEESIVSLKMSDVDKIRLLEDGMLIETGSRHFVKEVKSLENLDVFNIGRKIRHDPRFGSDGTNVNFIEPAREELKIRTFERGVEDETLACGTGAVAAAISLYLSGKTDKKKLIVHARGGSLKVHFTPKVNNSFENIWLTGPAMFVFEGEIKL